MASLHQVAYAVGGGLAGLLTQRVLAGVDRRTVIVLGLVVAAVAALGIGYGSVAVVTVAAAFVVSLAGTAALIRVWALLSDVHGRRRAVALSEGEVSVSLAGMVTPLLIGGLAATALSWRSAFAVTAAVVVAAALVVRALPMPPPSATGSAVPPSGRQAWWRPTLAVVLCVVALEFALSFWLASFLADDLGLPRDGAAAMVSLLYGAALAGRLLVSRLARRRTPEALLRVALLVTLVGAPVLLTARGAYWAGAGIVVLGIGMGATFPLVSSLHIQTSGLTSDRSMGQVLAVAAVGQVGGPFVAGVVAQVSDLRWGLLVLPAVSVVALAGLAVHGRRHPADEVTTPGGR